jgi:hypothetical protein
MWGLPDLKNILASFYQENIQPSIEQNLAYSQRTQQALIAIAFSLLLILIIAYFWP